MLKSIYALLSCVYFCSYAYASVIDTTGTWDGVSNIRFFGEPDTATYGQTITATNTYNVLNEFTFYIDDESFINTQTGPVNFAGYVQAWNGTQAVGSVLYQSGMRSTTNGFGMETFTFNTGGIQLVSNQQYVVYLSAVGFFDSLDDKGRVGALNNNPYAGGTFVYKNLSGPWQGYDTFTEHDLAFVMNFTPVPIPPAIWLFSSGFIGLMGLARRKS